MATAVKMLNAALKAILSVDFSESWRQRRDFVRAHPYLVLALALGMIALAGGDLAEVIPLLAPLAASPVFPFFHEVHDLLAIGLGLYVAYRWSPGLGLGAIILYAAAHVPYLILRGSDEPPEALRILLGAFVALIGIGLIAELRRATGLAERRQREIVAGAELTARALNERIQLLEEATRREQRLARLYQMIALAASQAQAPLDIAREFLGLVSEEVGAEYASFTLVRADGSLGERAESFRGLQPFFVSSRPGGLAEAILKTGQSQYVADAETDPRANPALVLAGIRSYLGLPLKADGQLVGILFLHSTHPHAFQEERQFLESIARLLALLLQRAELFSQVERVRRELDTTFDAISDGVMVMDEERKIICANEAFARMVGQRVQELPGKKVCPLVHGREHPISACPLERALALGRPQALEWREPYLGDKLLGIRVFPIPPGEGEPRRFVHVFRIIEDGSVQG